MPDVTLLHRWKKVTEGLVSIFGIVRQPISRVAEVTERPLLSRSATRFTVCVQFSRPCTHAAGAKQHVKLNAPINVTPHPPTPG